MKAKSISGTVKQFNGHGRRLGYPTANITIKDENLADGVYFGLASLDKYSDRPALIFVGVPYITGDNQRRLEAHLLDIDDRDYYGQTLKVRLLHYARPNQRFNDEAKLLQALKDDETSGRAWFKDRSLLS